LLINSLSHLGEGRGEGKNIENFAIIQDFSSNGSAALTLALSQRERELVDRNADVVGGRVTWVSMAKIASIIFFWLISTSVVALQSIPFDRLDEALDVAPFLEWLEDTENIITPEDILSGRQDANFHPNGAGTFIGLNMKSRYWLRLSLDPSQEYTNKYSEVIAHVPISSLLIWRLSVYAYINGALVHQTLAGHLEPYRSRDVDFAQYAFRLPVQAGKQTLMLARVDNTETVIPAILPLSIMNNDAFGNIRARFNFIDTLFYGMMSALFIYNLFLFFALKEKPVYGYYLLFLLCVMLIGSNNDGLSSRWLFPHEAVKNQFLNASVGTAAGMAYCAFVFSALDGRRQFPGFIKYYRMLLLFGLIGTFVVLSVDTLSVGVVITQTYSSVSLLSALSFAALCFTRKIPGAIYVLVAESLVLTGATIYMLMYYGLVPVNEFTIWGIHWGFLAESLVLSLALAARTRDAQQAALKNLEKFETLFDESPTGLFSYNIADKKLKCNTAFAKLFNRNSPEEFDQNEGALDYLSEADQQEVNSKLARDGRLTDYELYVEHPRGEIWASLSVRLVTDANGQMTAVDGSMTDITQRKLKEKAEHAKQFADLARKKAEAENKAKSDFLSKMSHEIRTPMTGIIGMADLLSDRLNDVTDQKFNSIILSSASALLTIINDILDYSKIEAGKMQLEAIPIDLEKLADEVLNIFQVKADEQGVELILDIAPNLYSHRIGDPVRIKQIMLNFMSNAIKFTESGSVTLVIDTNEASDNRVTIAVKDTGPGIAKDVRQQLFKAFSQASTATARLYGGTGLGLSICKELAEIMQGEVGVESVLGKGSMFWARVVLPIEPGSQQIIEPAVVNFCKNKRVLICHENSQVIRPLEKWLKCCGMSAKLLNHISGNLTWATDYDLVFYPEQLISDVKHQLRQDQDGARLVLLRNSFHSIPGMESNESLVLSLPCTPSQFLEVLYRAFEQEPPIIAAPKKLNEQFALLKSYKVLVAEDNPVNQFVLENMINKNGHRCTLVDNGTSAVNMFKSSIKSNNHFDIILMDFEMPETNGLDATKQIRIWESSSPQQLHTPIFGLTAEIGRERLQEGIDAGMDGYLLKPLHQRQLLELLSRLEGNGG